MEGVGDVNNFKRTTEFCITKNSILDTLKNIIQLSQEISNETSKTSLRLLNLVQLK